MITWLPYPDFVESAGALSSKTLNFQRKDVIFVLDIIHQTYPKHEFWTDHPVVRMWRGFEVALCEYGMIVCEETKARRVDPSGQLAKIETHMEWATDGRFRMDKPSWFGDPILHHSHQSNLVRHDPEHYAEKFPGVPADLPYLWPESVE